MPLPRVAVALPSLLLLLVPPARGEIIERIVAKVNGDIITLSEFEARQAAAVQAARVEPDRIASFLRENNARILQDAIDELLLVQRAADAGLRLRAEYVDEVVEGIKKENNIASDADLEQQLRREGMSLVALKRSIERSVLRRQILSRELEPRLTVTDADAQEDYEARLSEHTVPAAVHLQEILVEGEGALARARELVTRARAGEDFATLAGGHSAAATRSSGGDLGWVVRGEMSPVIEKVAGGLAPGEVSDPLGTGDGYRVFKVLEKRERKVTPFEEVKEEIKKRLEEQRSNKEYAAYMEQLRKEAIIDVRVREVPLEVSTPTAGTLLEPLAAEPKPASGGPEAEFVTSPQAAPERVAPPPTPTPPDAEKKDESKTGPGRPPS